MRVASYVHTMTSVDTKLGRSLCIHTPRVRRSTLQVIHVHALCLKFSFSAPPATHFIGCHGLEGNAVASGREKAPSPAGSVLFNPCLKSFVPDLAHDPIYIIPARKRKDYFLEAMSGGSRIWILDSGIFESHT